MKGPDDFTDPCVCGGSRAQPNPDCERCQLLAALAAATERLREVERERDEARQSIKNLLACSHALPDSEVMVNTLSESRIAKLCKAIRD